MRPIRSLQRNFGVVLATGGVLAALGLTASPMISVWQARNADEQALSQLTATVGTDGWTVPNQIVVELRNNSDVDAINKEFGINLKPNSIEADEDHLFVADLTPGMDEVGLIGRLKADSRIDVAEAQVVEAFPNLDATSNARPLWSPNSGFAIDQSMGSNTPEIAYPAVPSSAAPLVAETDPFEGSPNDPRYGEQWNFRMIGVEDAWKRTHGKGVVVAVIDTGVAITKSPKGVPCKDFGQTAYTKGYNFVEKNDDAYDDHAHGTHVAGTIAESTNNNEGVAGIAYDATIMPIKVLSADGRGTSAGVADGIRWAADHGANVINMSLGSPQPSDVIRKACQYAVKKNVTIVCAAGNDFGRAVGYPAAYPECIAVSAVGPTGKIAKYSSVGKQVALAAPGGDMIDSRDPADGILQNTNYQGDGGHGDDYYAFQGTSMACPHVAGVAALIESQGITDPAKVREILTKTAVPVGEPTKYGAGILSAAGATVRTAQVTGVKVRHWILLGVCMLGMVAAGRRKRMGLRLLMGGALATGMFGPDWFTNQVGADSAWNLLTFSAILPIVAYLALRRGPGIKVAGMLALGIAVNLYSNCHNDTLPFTSATFGDSPLPWTMANMGAALALGCAAAFRAFRATRSVSNAR